MTKASQTTLCMVRHGQTDWNLSGFIQGLTDNPLNATGIKQAHEAGKHLNKIDWDIIISSPLTRAKHTAEIIANHINYQKEIIMLDELIERDFGIADGKHVSDFYDLVMNEDVPLMESNEKLITRVMSGLETITTSFPNKKILIVCHSHVIKAALIHISNYEYDFTLKLENTSLNIINHHKLKYEIASYNTLNHLL